MRKTLLVIFSIISIVLLNGCGKDESKNYELIFGELCMNCYAKVYEFKDGTEVYHGCPEIKYKSGKTEMSLKEALDKKLIKLSDLKGDYGFKIVDSNTNPNVPVCSN